MLNKSLGQVFTPEWIVNMMLGRMSFTKYNILEPSCGDGAFLKEIVKRILDYPISLAKKKKILETKITAFELDTNVCKKCIKNLDEIAEKYGLLNVNWQIYNEDTLKHDFKDQKFSLIIGNPPYIRLHNLNEEARKFLKDNFSFCKGTTDIYLAFYQKCLDLLSEDGKLIFITPNSFLRNVGFKDFRNYIYSENLLRNIKDFKSSKIFEVSTYCAIMTLAKSEDKTFTYEEYNMGKKLFERSYETEKLKEDKWIFAREDNLQTISLTENINIQYGIATLRDKIYISNNYSDIDENYCSFNGYKVEKAIIKPIIKGSKVTRVKEQEYCIFPYKEENGKIVPYKEEEFLTLFPLAYNYFLDNKTELLKRDLDKNHVSWFQFGRSQGLQNMLKEKLIIDPIVNPKGRVICEIADSNTLVYSGIFVTSEDLGKIKDIISSKEFTDFVTIYGKDMQNGFKSLTTNIIKIYTKRD